MDQDWSAPGWAVLATLSVVVLLVAGSVVGLVAGRRGNRARAEAALGAARAEAEALRARVESIERRLAPAAARATTTEYKITMLGEEPAADEPAIAAAPVVGAPLFADLVLRESVVQAASLAAGLRRALAPEARNRIRFAMRREVKRARKQRRSDLRLARQQHEARRRPGAARSERADRGEGSAA